jgi:cysteine desulfurase/selenocysteine lyase
MPDFNLTKARRDFPILSLRVNGAPLIYFDNAATTHKPRAVIDKLNHFYKMTNANVHRGSHSLSNSSTTQFEQARETVAQFINAPAVEEVLWCKGTTEAINLVANSLGSILIGEGDTILVSVSEHHANIVPWQLLAQRKNAQLIPIPLTLDHKIDQVAYRKLLRQHRPKIVALGHVSNALGTIHPIQEMVELAQSAGAKTLVDGAQAIAHLNVDVQQLGCDFYCFSGHKCYGPTGIGVLWGKAELLNMMPAWQAGGEMISSVSFSGTSFNHIPFKFEAGTPPIADAIGLAAALTYLNSFERDQLEIHEKSLLKLLHTGCNGLPEVHCLSSVHDNVGIVSFTVRDVHHQDIALILDQSGIAVRSGHHCAMPLMESLKIDGTLRASISFYNSREEIERFLSALQHAIEVLSDSMATQQCEDEAVTTDEIKLPSEANVIDTLVSASSWQQRFGYLLQLGDLLPQPNSSLLQDKYKLAGCESGVWLKPIKQDANGAFKYNAWSDARIMRGLMVMLISCRLTALEDITLFLERTKLAQFLSPSRTSGVIAILNALDDWK